MPDAFRRASTILWGMSDQISLVARVLQPEEWPRLADTPLGATWPGLSPATTTIVVVEVGDQILACWAVLQAAHVEGLYIDPAARKNPRIAKALMGEMVRYLEAHDVREVLTQAETADVEVLIEKAGGSLVPGRTWVIPVGRLAGTAAADAGRPLVDLSADPQGV